MIAEPDEPVRFGQVWKYIVSKNEPIVMVIGIGSGEGYIRTLHLDANAVHIDLEDSGWATLADHKPTLGAIAMTTKADKALEIMEDVMAVTTGKRVYEITTSHGKMRVSIPENHRITYGPVSPGGKYGGSAMCLRVYEDATHQRMLVTDVQSFRDMSLPVMRAVVRQKGTRKWLPDSPLTMSSVLRGIKGSELERDWISETDLEVDAAEADPFPEEAEEVWPTPTPKAFAVRGAR